MLKFNENNEVIQQEEIKAILVGIQLGEDISYSMEELAGLAEAAGAEVLGVMIQNAERPNKATLIGSGKVEELAEMRENMGADTIIFNDELSGMQLRNLEDAVGARVIDRTILILDIFASRATSAEGKLQVELAQLRYRLPRLTGFGKSLSRLGGGIGTRGPGETKLETDRRHIARRIDEIKSEIEQIKRTRGVQRAMREKSGIPVVALVGYTNSGKSALMNRLLTMTEKEDKTVTEKDMLFATLDIQHRNIKFDNNREFILADTVGFVSRLPHSLVEAFKATLEEVKYADLLLHVVDASYEAQDFHIAVTDSVMSEIGAADKNRIMVYNKCDLLEDNVLPMPGRAESDYVFVSATRGDNIDKLLEMIMSRVFADMTRVKLLVPYTRGDITSYLMEKAQVHSTSYEAEGTLVDVTLSASDRGRLREFETE